MSTTPPSTPASAPARKPPSTAAKYLFVFAIGLVLGMIAIVMLLRCVDSLMIYTEAFTINAGGPNDATRFLTLELGEEIKGFSYGQAAARASLYFLIVLTIVWAFVIATRRDETSA